MLKNVEKLNYKIISFFLLIEAALICCCFAFNNQIMTADENFSFQVNTKSPIFTKIGCLILCIGQKETLDKIGKMIKFDFEFTDQLDVDLQKADNEPSDKVLAKLFNKGTSLCLLLRGGRMIDENYEVEATLKEPSTGQVLFNRKFKCNEKNIVYSSHSMSHELLPVLTGQQAPVLSTLAYCKQISPKNKVLCISDYACCKERVLFESNTINLAPRWHSVVPILFYSQLTRANNRLMSYDLKSGKRRVVCSYDGLNMQPSFSRDGTRAVLCLSAGVRGNSEVFLYDQCECNRLKKRVFIQLTNNGGNNSSPVLLSNNDVIFCSDFETKSPQIYHLDRTKNVTSRLTSGRGYCTAPSYCKQTETIVYNRLINGYFQLFTININDKNKAEHQLTAGAGDKQEPMWSECGRYIAFSYDCKEKKSKLMVSQIAVFNMISKKIRVMTKGDEPKSFPCWVNEPYYA
jgi:tol-pal system beta propeller repeat protein TolB